MRHTRSVSSVQVGLDGWDNSELDISAPVPVPETVADAEALDGADAALSSQGPPTDTAAASEAPVDGWGDVLADIPEAAPTQPEGIDFGSAMLSPQQVNTTILYCCAWQAVIDR